MTTKQSKAGDGPEPHRAQGPRRRRWNVMACLILLGIVLCLRPFHWFAPTYEGRRVSQWFEEFIQATNAHTPESLAHFTRMEDKITPHLTEWLEREPSRPDLAYARLHRNLPAWIKASVPRPRDRYQYIHRRLRALRLLEAVCAYQRLNHETNSNTHPPLVSTTMPHLQRLLNHADGITRTYAARTLASFGPAAAPAIPHLRSLLTNQEARSREAAAYALGRIGPTAAAAVPELIEIAKDPSHGAASEAIRALGMIGPGAGDAVGLLKEIAASDRLESFEAIEALRGIVLPAGRAAALLVPMLEETRGMNARVRAALAMTRIGVIPDESVSLLEAMRHTTNQTMRLVATVALWHRTPEDPVLVKALQSSFQSESSVVLDALHLVGPSPNASRFLPEISALLDHPDDYIRSQAFLVVRELNKEIP